MGVVRSSGSGAPALGAISRVQPELVKPKTPRVKLAVFRDQRFTPLGGRVWRVPSCAHIRELRIAARTWDLSC